MAEATELKIDIVSAEGQIHTGSAKMVYAPAEMGEVGIAPRHAPLLTRLKPGEVRVESLDGQKQSFFVSGGILEVQPHLVTVLSDIAERTEDIDAAAAEESQRRAEEAVAAASDKIDIQRAQAELVEAAARLHAVKQLKGVSR